MSYQLDYSGENWFKAKDFPDILFRSDKLVFTDDKRGLAAAVARVGTTLH